MDNLRGLIAFVNSVRQGSFSAAARQLGQTPAAVSKAVATLEKELGIRLLQRSTRQLGLTEAGRRFYEQAQAGLNAIDAAVAAVLPHAGEPEGVLKVSLAPAFGRDYILPLMDDYLQHYPRVRLDWHFDNRSVDVIGEGFDACIGGGFALDPGVIARELAPLHLIPVAAPSYLARADTPLTLPDLAHHSCIQWRSPLSGRVRDWLLENGNERQQLRVEPRVIVSDPDALCGAVVAGMGIGMLGMAHALPHLQSGRLQRLLPGWYQDAGAIYLYYPSQRGQSAKVRSFVEFVLQCTRTSRLAERLSALNQN